IVIEPDVVPQGTFDLASLDAAPGVAAPRVRVEPDGRVVRLGAASASATRAREQAQALEQEAARAPRGEVDEEAPTLRPGQLDQREVRAANEVRDPLARLAQAQSLEQEGAEEAEEADVP